MFPSDPNSIVVGRTWVKQPLVEGMLPYVDSKFPFESNLLISPPCWLPIATWMFPELSTATPDAGLLNGFELQTKSPLESNLTKCQFVHDALPPCSTT